MFEELLATAAVRPGARPAKLAADKGYSSDAIRRSLAERGVEAVIPLRRNEHAGEEPAFDAGAYKRRNVVERCVGRLKACRRIATRFEKLAVNFAAMVELAMIVIFLRLDL